MSLFLSNPPTEPAQDLLEWHDLADAAEEELRLDRPDLYEDLWAWMRHRVDHVGDAAFVAFCRWPGWPPLIGPPPDCWVNREPISVEHRWAIWERDNFTCQKCRARRYLSIDHKMPRSRGGNNRPSNLQTLCRSCNSAKGAR